MTRNLRKYLFIFSIHIWIAEFNTKALTLGFGLSTPVIILGLFVGSDLSLGTLTSWRGLGGRPTVGGLPWVNKAVISPLSIINWVLALKPVFSTSSVALRQRITSSHQQHNKCSLLHVNKNFGQNCLYFEQSSNFLKLQLVNINSIKLCMIFFRILGL